VAFVSLRDNLNLSTPSGRLLFQIIAAMAEFDRTLIAERVRVGLANAKKKGKKLGRPRVMVDVDRVAALRRSGASWQAISEELRVGIGTLYKAASDNRLR
jgi:putative DNA-invertase from lambdoid prophage Rac